MSTVTATRPSAVSWFELFASDFEGAVRFYETIFAVTLKRANMGGADLAIFPYEQPGIGGCVMQRDGVAGNNGTVVYLNADGKLDAVLARVPAAGGSIVAPKVQLPQIGWIATIADPEGNRIGLHAIS